LDLQSWMKHALGLGHPAFWMSHTHSFDSQMF
jgi:hypothetical protein